jgi:alpha-L-rhamnosidase
MASEWTGQWIWQAEEGSANSWVAFRKTFSLEEKPAEAIASIAVDTKYWLWVNGELVRFEGGRAGAPSMASPWNRISPIQDRPASEKPRNTWYQSIDLAPYLKEGENLVAILAWHWGRETHKGYHIDSGKGGLFFQMEFPGGQIVSGSDWKALQHPAYDPNAGEFDRNVIQGDVGFDANNAPGDWTDNAWYDIGYDASAWPQAVEKGAVPTAPWYDLVLDDIPPLKDHGLADYTNYPADSFPFVSDGSEIRARLPFNKQITPYLVIESGNGGELISIGTDDRLNRIEAYYTTRPGMQAFESYSWMNGHEVVYQIPAGITVHDLKYRWLSVGEIEGELSVSDPDLQRLWDMGANTLMVCARDNFMDCPDRERALWIGDVADQASYLFYVMGPDGRALLRRAIETTFLFGENGSYGALGPLRLRELPSQSLQFVLQCVWEYYLHTGDRETIEFSLPYIHAYLAKWQMGSDGLPVYSRGTSPDRWDWVDWGQENTHDKPVIQVALYYMALDGGKRMADLVGDGAKSQWFAGRMTSIEAAFDSKYWAGEYYSSSPGSFQDDRANALAILSGLAGEERHQPIVENVLVPNHYCSPHFEWMVNLAMSEAGFTKEAMERMKARYSLQIGQEGLTTLYENFPAGGSYNHAWNAPNTVIAKRIVGIRPIEAGWKRFQVTPEPLDIEELQQLIPTVSGDIEITWKNLAPELEFTLTVPPGTSARFDVPINALPEPAKSITLNENVVWADAGDILAGEVINVSSTHVTLDLPAGQWTIAMDCECEAPPPELLLEAEEANLKDASIRSATTASGGQYAFSSTTMGITWNLTYPVALTELTFRVKALIGERSLGLFLNESEIAQIRSSSREWTNLSLPVVLPVGENEIELRAMDGALGLDVDYLKVNGYKMPDLLAQYNPEARGISLSWQGTGLKLQAAGDSLAENQWSDVSLGSGCPEYTYLFY